MEVASVLDALTTFDSHRKISVLRSGLFDLLMLSRNGVNVQSALPTVAKLLAFPDGFVKRIAGELMVIHCNENQDIALLAINTLVQDCGDLNPLIRGLSFKIIGNLSINLISDVFSSSVTHGLSDQNVYVRRAAALAAVGLNKVSSTIVLEGDIWDLLYCRLRDDDPMTVASCLCALEEVCAGEKGVVVSNKMALYLIKNMDAYTPTVQRLVLQFLTKFSPKTKPLVFESLNELDVCLSKPNSVVKTLCTLNLFCHLTSNLPHVQQKVHKVAWSTIDKILSGERNEELFSVTLHFLNSTSFPVEKSCRDVSKFLCQEYEPTYLINQKIKFLSRVMSEDNVDKIFGDFLSCVRTMSKDSIRNLVQSIADIVNGKEVLRKDCAKFLTQLVETRKSDIIDEVIQILPSISMADKEAWTDLMSNIEANHSLVTSMQAHTALLQVIQSYPSYFPHAPHIFDQMMKIVEENQDSSTDVWPPQEQGVIKKDRTYDWFKITFLCAATQAFLCYPAKIHPYVVKMMEVCVTDSSPYVREKGLFYYSYLIEKVQGRSEN